VNPPSSVLEQTQQDEAADSDDEGNSKSIPSFVQRVFGPVAPICTDAAEAYGILHRLDMQTSGPLLLAKTYLGSAALRAQFSSHKIEKEYVCLAQGIVPLERTSIDARIKVSQYRGAPGSGSNPRGLNNVCEVARDGKPSFTELRRIALLKDTDGAPYSLCVVKLHTGRTHQIRVHMNHIGHGLVTDNKYGLERFAADQLWCARNFLHTYRLVFNDVHSGEKVETLHPLPEDLRQALESLSADGTSGDAVLPWTQGQKPLSFADYAQALTS